MGEDKESSIIKLKRIKLGQSMNLIIVFLGKEGSF